MKRFLILCIIIAVLTATFAIGCYAQDSASADVSYSEKEQAIREILNKLLDEGDEIFSEAKPWEAFSGWVREHSGNIVAVVAGMITLVGALLVLLRTNPQLKAYVTSLGKSWKSWVESVTNTLDGIGKKMGDVKNGSDDVVKNVKNLQKMVSALTEALEDVIKLSGADEEKKAIYINRIETAKTEVGAADEK